MSNEKTYTCVCGRVFNNPQAFNGHKSHCIKHNIEKYGSTEYLKSVETRRHSDAQAKTIVSTLEELYQAIVSFDKVYGEYPNKINYVGLDMFVGSSPIRSTI